MEGVWGGGRRGWGGGSGGAGGRQGARGPVRVSGDVLLSVEQQMMGGTGAL